MLAGKGFDRVINVSGGFKAWQGEAAFGDELQGLELFSGDETAETTLVIAYSLETGLRDFYLTMAPKAGNQAAQSLFQKMAAIELKHQDRILAEYGSHTGQTIERDAFEQNILKGVVEGGLTTEEYIQRFNPSLDSLTDIISLAMSIEAQALDLYHRAAANSSDQVSRAALRQIADEEKAHLAQLGKLMETIEQPALKRA
jgi:rubrerythrin